MRRTPFAALAVALLAAGSAQAAPCRTVVAPPAEGIYHAAFPYDDAGDGGEDDVTEELVEAFESTAGRRIAWAYFTNAWIGGSIRFPRAQVEAIAATGAVPFVRLHPRSELVWPIRTPDPLFTLNAILSGRFDDGLRGWARAARDARVPLMVELGTEVNGSWFPWNGLWAGAGDTGGYGDPRWPDGPERFREAYRRVVRLFRAEGAMNVTWVFHVNAGSSPDLWWNQPRWYYPGDAYVDWLGTSAYGSVALGERWRPFAAALRPSYRALVRLSSTKPIAVLEFGVPEDAASGDKAAWIRAAFAEIESGRYPRLKAISWWNERWVDEEERRVDLRIDSSPAALAAYRAGIDGSGFVERARVETRC